MHFSYIVLIIIGIRQVTEQLNNYCTKMITLLEPNANVYMYI